VGQIFVDGGEFLIIHSSERTPRHLLAHLVAVGIDAGAHGVDEVRKLPLLDKIEVGSERPKNKDRGKELFLSSMVAPPGAGFRNRAESSMAQNEDVLGRETEARKLFIVGLSEPRPYALLAWVVVSPNKPAHQARSGFQRRCARGHASARKLDSHRQPPDFVAEGAHGRTRARASAGRKLST
jgi:hypothetical protein